MIFYVVMGLSAFMISLLGARLTIMAMRSRALPPGYPGARLEPKSGGIAVVIALIICLLVADINYGIALAMFLLTAVALMDSVIGVPAPIRLLSQLMAVLIPLSMIHAPIFSGELSAWVDKGAAALLWIWFINQFNALDGVDGLPATEMICIGLGLCLVAVFSGQFPHSLLLYSLILGSAGAGFLWWSWSPAKIRLGDVGGMPIGFLIGYLLLLAVVYGYGYAALILPAYCLADGGVASLRKLRLGQSIWIMRSEHYCQIAVARGIRRAAVVRRVFGINLLLIMLATLSTIERDLVLFHLAMGYMIVFMMLGFFAHANVDPKHDPL